ncbi:Poly [ADP-ribose] polymerase 1 [Balamuthia mandrillaris]
MSLKDDFRIEYAKSNRSSCKHCKTKIEKDSLRIGILEPASNFDGEIYVYHHVKCFFDKRPDVCDTTLLKGFDLLRPSDRPKIQRFTDKAKGSSSSSSSSSASTSSSATDNGSSNNNEEGKLKDDFRIEYAKSSRSSCRHCKTKIEKDTLRIGILESASNFDGEIYVYHHVKCFFHKRPDVKSVALIKGFDTLRPADQPKIKRFTGENESSSKDDMDVEKESGEKPKSVKKKSSKKPKKTSLEDVDSMTVAILKEELKSRDLETTGLKKALVARLKKALEAEQEDGEEGEEEEEASAEEAETEETEEEKYVRQLWELKDQITSKLATSEMKEVLEKNNQSSRGGKDDLAQRIADGVLLGAIPQCPKCQKGALHYEQGQYTCHHHATSWSKCTFTASKDELTREKWKNPKWWHSKITKVSDKPTPKSKTSDSKKRKQPASSRSKGASSKKRRRKDSSEEEEEETGPVFDGLRFLFLGDDFTKSVDEFKTLINDNGGVVLSKFTPKINYVVATDKGVIDHQDTIKKAINAQVPCLDENFILDSVEAKKLEDQSLYRLPLQQIEREEEEKDKGKEKLSGSKRKTTDAGGKEEKKSRVEEMEETGRMKQVRKGRAAIDIHCAKAEKVHVLEEGDTIYNVMLNLTDVTVGQRGRNSFYCLQLLEHDAKAKWYTFRRWGRVGTPGAHKIERHNSRDEAIDQFTTLYFDKTGNNWEERHNFAKVPGKFYPIELDYGNDEKEIKLLDVSKSNTGSKLDPRVQQLVCSIFDIEVMKHTLVELEIDIKKMPLGKLSKKHIQRGYEVLSEIQKLIESDAPDKRDGLLDCTNRFYTLIPQDFGSEKPPVIDNLELLNKKSAILEALQEIEIAQSMLTVEGGSSSGQSAIDQSYEKLNTTIEPLDKNSEEFKALEEYAVQGHDRKYFRNFDLEVVDIFRIERHGNEETFKPWKDDSNRQLLWHGSRLSNFVGILSQGLRIAPPEAPKSGYRFGKGVYFADIISKSASYCRTSSSAPLGIMLLNEVALGTMNELLNDQYMEKPSPGTHSTKALGATAPNPAKTVVWDGVQVPKGEPIHTGIRSSCSHNEYIVYDTSQIKMRYLLMLDFKHKGY